MLKLNKNKRRISKKMKHFKTITQHTLKETAERGGCGKCRASCQSACKTSCTVANQTCENSENGSKK